MLWDGCTRRNFCSYSFFRDAAWISDVPYIRIYAHRFLTEPGMFAIAGMAALFAASTRSPITGAVLVVEMTHNYYLIFPVMMACITATIVLQLAPNGPIYEQLLHRTLVSKKIR